MQSIGAKILAATKERHPNHHHPRLIMTEADFARLREKRGEGAYKTMLDKTIAEADKILDLPPRKYEIPDGVRLLVTSRAVLTRLMHLCYAYYATGEEKYAARAVVEIVATVNFPDWHPRHFLDCAELCAAIAFAYDWLYDYLSEDLKAAVRAAIIKNGFNAVMEEYNNEPEHKNVLDPNRGYRWYQDKPGDNWKMVCNGGLTLAVLAIFDEIECDLCETILNHAYDDTYEAVRKFYDEQDGTYSEGVGYWSYATRYLSFYSSGLQTAAGSDFGLTDWIGLARSPYFLLSMSSPNYIGFNFGDAVESKITSPLFSWCAARFDDPALYAIRKKDILEGKSDFVDVLYFRDVPDVPLKDMPLAFGRPKADNATFRTSAEPDALFAGIHFAKNNAYHGHKDMGTFILNIGAKRFFVDLGMDNYNLKPYRGCYRFRAEGHNTIIFNPSPENDQAWEAGCTTDRFFNCEDYGFAIADMSAAYPERRAVRGMMLHRPSKSVLIQDEIECKAEDVIRWAAHTPAVVNIAEDGKTAVLDMDGTKLFAELLTEGAFAVTLGRADEYSPIVQPAPRESDPTPAPQKDNEGISRLFVLLSGKESHRIAIRFTEMTDAEITPAEVKPLSLWN